MTRPPPACAPVLVASALLLPAASPAEDPKEPAAPPAPKVRVTATRGKTLKPSALVTYKPVGGGKRPLALHVIPGVAVHLPGPGEVRPGHPGIPGRPGGDPRPGRHQRGEYVRRDRRGARVGWAGAPIPG